MRSPAIVHTWGKLGVVTGAPDEPAVFDHGAAGDAFDAELVEVFVAGEAVALEHLVGGLQPGGHEGLEQEGNPLRPQLPVRIHDPRCVAKTFPQYFDVLNGIAER